MTDVKRRVFSEVLCNRIYENISRMEAIHSYVMEYMSLEEENRRIMSGMKELGIPALDETIASYFEEMEDWPWIYYIEIF